MEIKYYPGFAFFDFGGSDPLFISLHSTTSLEYIPRGDMGSDLVAFHLAQNFGTKCILSLIPRERMWGVDLNRISPSFKLARRSYLFFQKNDLERMFTFQKKYAFVAKDKMDFAHKKSIYDSFWNLIRAVSHPNTLHIIIHTQDSTLKNFPSLIDITSFGKIGKKILKKIIEKINSRYERAFHFIGKKYVDYMTFSTKYHFASIMRMKYGKFDPKLFKGYTRDYWQKLLKRVKELNPKAYKLLKSKQNFRALIDAIKLCATDPRITWESNFGGKYSHGTKKFLREIKGKGVQFECCSFLTESHPDLAVKLISDFIGELKLNLPFRNKIH